MTCWLTVFYESKSYCAAVIHTVGPRICSVPAITGGSRRQIHMARRGGHKK
uniref:Serum albumin-like protein n=1 Tax=Penaeus monodon TaxID=6687 RepID=Q8MWB8_PENMO|nr:serum albumin precursor-like protein [Penaeus monodon]